jgi:hypothetical protein
MDKNLLEDLVEKVYELAEDTIDPAPEYSDVAWTISTFFELLEEKGDISDPSVREFIKTVIDTLNAE